MTRNPEFQQGRKKLKGITTNPILTMNTLRSQNYLILNENPPRMKMEK